MIRWESNFNIPDSTVQVAVAYVRVVSHEIKNSETLIRVVITGEVEDVVIKEYDQTLAGQFSDIGSIYEEIMPEFMPSSLVPV